MQSDADQIRDLVKNWMIATQQGAVDRILDLMSDDVVFLVTGRAPMGKAEFEAISRSQSGETAPKIEGDSQIQEIQVMGDWAYMWSRLTVVITPVGAQPITRSGHTLTIFRKEDGRWRLARDANMLATQTAAAATEGSRSTSQAR